MESDIAVRAREWRRETLRAVSDLRPWEFGHVARSRSLPTSFAFNAVIVERDPSLSVDELTAVADRELMGLPHRSIEFTQPSHALQFRADLKARGWRTLVLVRMRHCGVRPAVPDAVHELPYESVDPLRVSWHREDFPEIEAEEHFDRAAAFARARGARVLAVLRAGEPVGYAQVERVGGDAEITDVYVQPAHRGRGLGTQLTQAAIAAALPARDVWIEADAEDRPRHLYERLGFRPGCHEVRFLVVPAGHPAHGAAPVRGSASALAASAPR